MALITAELVYDTGVSMLKAAHLESFSGGLIKVKIFILQIDNKITDAAETFEERKIRYKMSLLRESVTE